jgi:hypothetical protein
MSQDDVEFIGFRALDEYQLSGLETLLVARIPDFADGILAEALEKINAAKHIVFFHVLCF